MDVRGTAQHVLDDPASHENALAKDTVSPPSVSLHKSRRRSSDGGSNEHDTIGGRSVTYAAFIRSDAWRFSPARSAELLASGGRCRICGEGEPATRLHVHHRTYVRLGCELPGDLTTLCEPCHDGVTAMLRGRTISSRRLPEPIDLPQTSSHRVLVDSLESDR